MSYNKQSKLLPTLGILACLLVTCCCRSLEGASKRQALTKREPESFCGSKKFLCTASRMCIPRSWLCDGENDCIFGEDEQQQNCDVTTTYSPTLPPTPNPRPIHCGDDEVHCEPTQCVLRSQLCDGSMQCANGADEIPSFCEQYTTSTIKIKTTTEPASWCGSKRFLCTASRRCIPRRWLCDGENDCKFGEDERQQNCDVTTTYSPTLPPTPNSRPIRCGDDEVHCEPTQCVLRSQLCDGSAQCVNGADEIPSFCERFTTSTIEIKTTTEPESWCGSNKFLCRTSNMCIPRSWLCDGENDCLSGEDEEQENCVKTATHPTSAPTPYPTLFPNQVRCEDDEVYCEPTQCVLMSQLCDGLTQCANGADEIPSFCERFAVFPSTPRPPLRCADDEFTCEPTQCVPRSLLCDGIVQCSNGADESLSLCPITRVTTMLPSTPDTGSSACLPDYIKCYSGKCIPFRWRCDGEKDCSQGEDEVDCSK